MRAALRVMDKVATTIFDARDPVMYTHTVAFDNRLNTAICMNYDFKQANMHLGLAGATANMDGSLTISEYNCTEHLYEIDIGGIVFQRRELLPAAAFRDRIRWSVFSYAENYDVIEFYANVGDHTPFAFWRMRSRYIEG